MRHDRLKAWMIAETIDIRVVLDPVSDCNAGFDCMLQSIESVIGFRRAAQNCTRHCIEPTDHLAPASSPAESIASNGRFVPSLIRDAGPETVSARFIRVELKVFFNGFNCAFVSAASLISTAQFG